jgi:hypothetical protein
MAMDGHVVDAIDVAVRYVSVLSHIEMSVFMCPVSCGHSFGIGTLLNISPKAQWTRIIQKLAKSPFLQVQAIIL